MSVIRKKPYLESFIESLDEETLQSLKSVVNGSGSLQEASFSDLPEEAVAPVYFNLDKNDYKNGVLVQKEPSTSGGTPVIFNGTTLTEEASNTAYFLNKDLSSARMRELFGELDFNSESDFSAFGCVGYDFIDWHTAYDGQQFSEIDQALYVNHGLNILKFTNDVLELGDYQEVIGKHWIYRSGSDEVEGSFLDYAVVWCEDQSVVDFLNALFTQYGFSGVTVPLGWNTNAVNAYKNNPFVCDYGPREGTPGIMVGSQNDELSEVFSLTPFVTTYSKGLLVAYHRFQDLQLYELDLAKHTYTKINEYCDINEFRRVLDKVAPSTDVYTENVFASDEIEFSSSSGDFGEKAKARIKAISEVKRYYIFDVSGRFTDTYYNTVKIKIPAEEISTIYDMVESETGVVVTTPEQLIALFDQVKTMDESLATILFTGALSIAGYNCLPAYVMLYDKSTHFNVVRPLMMNDSEEPAFFSQDGEMVPAFGSTEDQNAPFVVRIGSSTLYIVESF